LAGIAVKCRPDKVSASINGELLTVDLRFLSGDSFVEVSVALRMAVALKDRLEELLRPWVREALLK